MSIPKEIIVEGNFQSVVEYELIESVDSLPTIKLEYYIKELTTKEEKIHIKLIE